MGNVGRPPIPIDRHKVRGTFRKDRHKEEGVVVPRGIPPMPESVAADEYARAQWERVIPRLDGMGVLTEGDESALEVHCLTFAEWKRCQDHLAEHGPSYEFTTGGGQPVHKEYPEALRWKQLLPVLGQQFAKFGLTPVDRASAKPGKAEEPEADDFFARRASG